MTKRTFHFRSTSGTQDTFGAPLHYWWPWRHLASLHKGDRLHTLQIGDMSRGKILFEKTGQAPAPSKDFHQLLMTETEVIWRTWRISVRKDQRYIPPSQRRVPFADFDDDSLIQIDITRVFGEDTLRLVHAIACGDWLIRLPAHVIVRIASYLDLEDIVRVGAVCKFLRKVCSSDELWEEIYRSHCGTVTDETKSVAREIGWKKVFFTNKLQLQVQLRRRKERNSAEQRNGEAKSEEPAFITQTRSTWKSLSSGRSVSRCKEYLRVPKAAFFVYI